jgi:hypothetical protein
MSLPENKNIRLLSIGLIIVFFTNLLFNSLLIGGRWDLNEQIAFGERLSNGFSGYAKGTTDLFFPSSPYFPGGGYLSYFYKLIGIDSLYTINQLMLFTAVAIGFLYFILLRKLTLSLYPQLSANVVTIVLILLYVTHFKVYMMYMMEFKPDTVLLVIAILSFLLLERNKKPRTYQLITVGILLFSATFFKQSFFIIFLFVFILIFLSGHFSLKEKTRIILLYGLMGIFALYLIFNVAGIYYFSIEVMGQHPMLDMKAIIDFFILGIKSNMIFILILLFFLTKRLKTFSVSSPESKYLIFALLWFVFSAVSTAKLGGNSGNLEVGLIVFIPFIIDTVDHFLNRFYSKKVALTASCILLLVGTLVYSYKTASNFRNLMVKINDDNASIAFLSQNFRSKKALIDGNTYIIAEMSDMQVVTELETLAHFNNVPGYNFYRLKDALIAKKYDVLFLSQPDVFSIFEDENIGQLVKKNYTIYENSGMPVSLKGKILIPKKKE